VFSGYANNAYEVQKLLVRNCIERLLPNPLVKTDLPSTAELTVTEQKGRRIVHVLHYPAERRAPDLDIVEEAIPLPNVNIALRTDQKPKQAYLVPQRHTLKLDYNDGYASIVIPSVQGHQMAVFEL